MLCPQRRVGAQEIVLQKFWNPYHNQMTARSFTLVAGFFTVAASAQEAGATHIDTSRSPPRPPPPRSSDLAQLDPQHIVVSSARFVSLLITGRVLCNGCLHLTSAVGERTAHLDTYWHDRMLCALWSIA